MLKCLLGMPIGILGLSGLMKRAFAWRQKTPLDATVSVLLFEGSARMDSMARDLRGNASAAIPTVEQCLPYRQLIWQGYKSGSAPLNFSIRARATDLMGMPLNFNWRILMTGTINTPPNQWFRITIPEGYWDQYRVELTSPSPQQVYSRLLGVRWASTEVSSLADTLLVMLSDTDSTVRDLLGNTFTELPTLDGVDTYSRLIWMGVKSGAADVAFTIFARTADIYGNPLSEAWLPIGTGTLVGPAGSWFRVETKQGFFDQYRIVVSSTTRQQLTTKIVGVFE